MLTKIQMRHSLACALMSRVAYSDIDLKRTMYADLDLYDEWHADIDELKELGYDYISGHEIDGTEFSVAQSRDDQIIAIRGSSSVQDFINDLKAQIQTPTPFGRVGKGFEDYVTPIVNEVISTAYMSTRQVTFTGHSLGGAAALYLAALTYHTEGERFQTITFGCPRVGDRRFTFGINQNFPYPFHQRWVNGNDVITKLPWQMGRFVHPNALQYITTKKEILTSPSMVQIFLNRWGWFNRSPVRWATDQVADHSIDNYINAIRESIK